MNIHDVLQQADAHRPRKRVGRGNGSGLGKTAGRGDDGAKKRSGWSTRYSYEGGQMPLARRLPKRGFRNSNFARRFDVINVSELERGFQDGDTVDLAAIEAKLGFSARFGRLKILGNGEVSKKLNVVAAKFSKSAQAKIEASGGTCTVPSPS